MNLNVAYLLWQKVRPRLIGQIVLITAFCASPYMLYASKQTDALGRPTYAMQLPVVLSPVDRAIYHNIFEYQNEKNWHLANEEIRRVDNQFLIGHVLASRYLQKSFKATKEQFIHWLAHYEDHPEAYTIYKLARKRYPKVRFSKPRDSGYLSGRGDDHTISSSEPFQVNFSWRGRPGAMQIWRKVNRYVDKAYLSYAYDSLQKSQNTKYLKPIEHDVLLWRIAQGFFTYGKDQKALTIAKVSAHRSGKYIPHVYWTAGIAAWRLEDLRESEKYFQKLADARKTSAWYRSAAHFWLYRIYDKEGKSDLAVQSLAKSASYTRTLYGMLSMAMLKERPPLKWRPESIHISEWKNLYTKPGVHRAIALMELGKMKAAESEMRELFPDVSMKQKQILMGMASRFNMPALQVRMGSRFSKEYKEFHDYALYPIPHWRPRDGFTTEPALLFALMRHESGFNPKALSPVGAKGLMQVMPRTASYVAKRKSYKDLKLDMFNPAVNMQVGQDYVDYLMKHKYINGNLLYFAVAYNAGPNRLNRWLKKVDHDNDPLLFVESLPSRETRQFVKQVLFNYWVYQGRFAQESISLQQLARGEWPRYNRQENVMASLE